MLNSLYEKAIAKRGFIHDIDSETDIESILEYKWFNRKFEESSEDFTIAAGDGSFNKRKFLTTNFCAVFMMVKLKRLMIPISLILGI